MPPVDARSFSLTELSPSRRWILEFLSRAKQTSLMHSMVDVDVTEALARIASYERSTGERIHFSAFLLRCVARTVQRFPELNSYLYGRNHIMQFRSVDIATVIDHVIHGKHVPINYIVRAAQSKTIREIHDELEAAKANPPSPSDAGLLSRLFDRLPERLQHPVWRIVTRDPRVRRSLEGTVLVSDVTKFTNRRVAIRSIAPSGASLTVVFVSLGKQPWVVDDAVVPRDILRFTCSGDHRVMDGAVLEALRFLNGLLESGAELPAASGSDPNPPQRSESCLG